jgi:RimJ/RimL family protein N-acetyltransferase
MMFPLNGVKAMKRDGCPPVRTAATRLVPAWETVRCREAPSAASPAAVAAEPGRRAAQVVLVNQAMGSTAYVGMLEQMADQPVGEPVHNWTVPPRPERQRLSGHYCRVEPLNCGQHAAQLWDAFALDTQGRDWTYLSQGPYDTFDAFREWCARSSASDDPLFFTILDTDDRAVGVAAYLRISPDAGTIEVGHIHLSPLVQRTAAATEAMFLMMRQAFALGYRRYEWKCDSLNAPSRAAAERLGFTFEGIFRQALVYKGRNRDTAWYSIIDREWPWLCDAFEQWLAPANFDESGGQRVRLSVLVNSARIARSRA